MDIRQDATILGSDGQDVGTLDKLIIEPGSGAATDAVLRLSSGQEVVVPIGCLHSDAPSRLRTALSQDELSRLPRLDEDRYERLPGSRRPPDGWASSHVRWRKLQANYPVAAANLQPAEPEPSRVVEPVRDPGAVLDGFEERREQEVARSHDPYGVDPEHLLDDPPSRLKTPYERDDASMLNRRPSE